MIRVSDSAQALKIDRPATEKPDVGQEILHRDTLLF